ncbi:hypothetical protein BDF20DRAFT_864324 [Mycotypha africana]|uniref:uncharacterized protein n=1 Tax=Mycotypha africana TaxID=64632 RepID=UPI0023017B32|nr:uncharacterized protein BDF20DRAFT_864324 [Mycotypha africana]KAI8981961.1 hypothetical protein BDF20DRAFT_864324 [Mycotypha africana]
MQIQFQIIFSSPVKIGALDQIRDLQSFIDNFQVQGADAFNQPYGTLFIDNEKTELIQTEQFPLSETPLVKQTTVSTDSHPEQLQKPNAKIEEEPSFSLNGGKVLVVEPEELGSRAKLSSDLSSLLHNRNDTERKVRDDTMHLTRPYQYHEHAPRPQQSQYDKAPMPYTDPCFINIAPTDDSSHFLTPQHIASPPTVRSRRASISSRKSAKSAKSTKSAKSSKSCKSPKSIKNAKRQHLQEKKLMLQQQNRIDPSEQTPEKQYKQKYIPRTYEEMMRISDTQERMKFYEKTIDLCLKAETPIGVWRKKLDEKNTGHSACTSKTNTARSTPVSTRKLIHKQDLSSSGIPTNSQHEAQTHTAKSALRHKPTSKNMSQTIHPLTKKKPYPSKPNLKDPKDNAISTCDTDGSNKVLVRTFSKFSLTPSMRPNHFRATSWHQDNSYSHDEAVAHKIIPPVPSSNNVRRFPHPSHQKNRVSAISTSHSKEQLLTDQLYIKDKNYLNAWPSDYKTITEIRASATPNKPIRRHSLNTIGTNNPRSTLTATYATDDNIEHLRNILPQVDMYTLKNALIEAKGDPVTAVSVALSLLKKQEEEANKIQYSHQQHNATNDASYYLPSQKLHHKKSFISTMKTSTAKLFKLKK